jgi:hypothetical protein
VSAAWWPDGLARFRLFASAIAGRLVDVAAVEPGTLAWTDGATVYVDADARPSEQLRSIAVQAALLNAESLQRDILGSLGRRPALTRRYLAVEGHRALAAQEAMLPLPARLLIDHSVAARSKSPAQSLAIANGREIIDDPPECFGMIRPRKVKAVTVRPIGDGAAQRHVPQRRREESLRELDDEEDDERSVVDLLSSPVGGGGGIGRLLKKMFGDARSVGSGPPGADSPTHWARSGARVARTIAVTTAAASIAGCVDPVASVGSTYPEWDAYRRRYRLDWCTVFEADPSPEDLTAFAPPDSHALRRPLARLGMDLERCHRQTQGEDIDIDAVIEARVDTMVGSAPDEGLYIESVRRRRDLAVLLLLDISGSAGEPSPIGGSVHDHQRTAAAVLTVALHELGDRVALYGFRSRGRSAVHVLPAKRFGDELDALVMQRLGGFIPAAYTRLGAAIRHGATVLERDGGMSRQLLVVLSDGFAYDHGYEGAYAEADARRALAEARRRGTGCLCLSVGAGTDATTLRRVFGTAAHATIPRAEHLPAIVGPLFRSALRSAEAQRRVSLRKQRTTERLEIERRAG